MRHGHSLAIFVDLWREVVLQGSEVFNLKLNHEGGLRREHQFHVVAERRRLVKHVEVAQSEGEADTLCARALVLLGACLVVGLDFDDPRADLALDGELNVGLRGFDCDSLAQLVELAAKLAEVK